MSQAYLVDGSENILLGQINRVLHAGRWDTVHWITGKVFQNDFLDTVPGLVEIEILN